MRAIDVTEHEPWPERLEWEHGADPLRWPDLYDEVPDQDLADEDEE